jgi:hypothetical protein
MDPLVTLDATTTPFLRKLLLLLNDVPPSVAAWDQSGSVFIVYNGAAFEALSRNYFKGTLQTFIRQLHFYGFSKMDMPNLGINIWSFSHPYFLRDSPSLITEIRRRTGGGHIASSNAGSVKSPGAISTATIPEDERDSSPSRATKLEVKTSTHRIKELEKKMKMLEDIVEQLYKFVDGDFAEGEKTTGKKRSLEASVEDDEDQPKQLRKPTSFESSSSFNDFADSFSSTSTAPAKRVKKKEDVFSSSTDDFMIDSFTDEVEPKKIGKNIP